MKYSLKSKLSFSYAAMALVLVALISFCINVLLQNQFKNYIIKQQEQKNREVVSLVEHQYSAAGLLWNINTIENIGVNALEQGIILKIKDKNDGTVWDATIHNNGLCVQMLTNMANNMQRHDPNFKGGYEQTGYPMIVGGQSVGTIEVGYYGPYYYNDNDLAFLNTINEVLIAVGVLSLLMAALLGTFMAKRVSDPISKSIKAAGEIAKGNLKQRLAENYSTLEMIKLTQTINHLADSLQNQEGLRKRMSADVAHELRTPLANLQSSLEAMIDGIWQPSGERLKSCHEEILRINRLVGDLEKLERMEAESRQLTLSEFDITELTGYMIKNFETEFYKKEIRLHFSGSAEIIMADRDKISQVLVNLISNALKYTSSGGCVEVRVAGREQEIEISVQDSGEGISPEDLPYIFERFYRSDQSRSRLTGGSGLGLTISKAIIESHNGQIHVSSEPGKGTTFTVSLPKLQV